MNPLTVNPLPLLAVAVVAVVIGFGAGWSVNGWRLEANVAKLERDNAADRANSANAALDQLGQRMENMSTAAGNAQLDVSVLAAKMDQIRKDQKNAQATRPLDPGCKPDGPRLDRLRDAVSAANAAIEGSAARQRTGQAVPGSARP